MRREAQRELLVVGIRRGVSLSPHFQLRKVTTRLFARSKRQKLIARIDGLAYFATHENLDRATCRMEEGKDVCRVKVFLEVLRYRDNVGGGGDEAGWKWGLNEPVSPACMLRPQF